MSYWPTNAPHTTVLHALYYTAAALGVTITDPADNALVTVDNPRITWELDSGTQVERRVRIFEPDGITTVYDSGTAATATLFVDVTPGLLATGIEDYIVRVEALNDAGLIGVATSHFDTTFQPSVPVTGLRLTEFGDKCFRLSYPELPRIRVRWDQVVPGPGETFDHYDVVRREAGSSTWETIRIVNDITTTTIDDYNFRSYTSYEYGVIWTALDGADVLVSLPETPAPTARVEFDWTFLHDVGNPANWVVFYSLEGDEEREGDSSFDRLWGRTKPTQFVGEDDHVVVQINGLPDGYDGDVWDNAEELFAAQRATGATICVRRGKQRRVNFCGISRLSRNTGQEQYEPRIELTEISFDQSLLVEA